MSAAKVAYLLTFDPVLPDDSKLGEFCSSLFDVRKLATVCREDKAAKQVILVVGSDKNIEMLTGGNLWYKEHRIDVVEESVAKVEERIRMNKTKLYVGGIPHGVDNIKLWKHFARYGTLDYTYIIKNGSASGHKGFGFVIYENRSGLEKAIQVKHYIDGHRLSCQEFHNKTPKGEAGSEQHINDKPIGSRSEKTQTSSSSDKGEDALPMAHKSTDGELSDDVIGQAQETNLVNSKPLKVGKELLLCEGNDSRIQQATEAYGSSQISSKKNKAKQRKIQPRVSTETELYNNYELYGFDDQYSAQYDYNQCSVENHWYNDNSEFYDQQYQDWSPHQQQSKSWKPYSTSRKLQNQRSADSYSHQQQPYWQEYRHSQEEVNFYNQQNTHNQHPRYLPKNSQLREPVYGSSALLRNYQCS